MTPTNGTSNGSSSAAAAQLASSEVSDVLQERLIDAEYKIWKKNTPYLYVQVEVKVEVKVEVEVEVDTTYYILHTAYWMMYDVTSHTNHIISFHFISAALYIVTMWS
jgi:hypothetical protein